MSTSFFSEGNVSFRKYNKHPSGFLKRMLVGRSSFCSWELRYWYYDDYFVMVLSNNITEEMVSDKSFITSFANVRHYWATKESLWLFNKVNQYSTRYSDFYRPHTCRTNIKKFSILFQGPRIWNSLPNDIKNALSFSIFKRVIKPFLRVRQNAT